MILRFMNPRAKAEEYVCDSVHLPLHDGDMGVRAGHEEAVVALSPGDIQALENGAEVLRRHVNDGFVIIRDNTISVYN